MLEIISISRATKRNALMFCGYVLPGQNVGITVVVVTVADVVVLVIIHHCKFAPRQWRGRAVARGGTVNLSGVVQQSSTEVFISVVNCRSCE